jgi:hypothetical protein
MDTQELRKIIESHSSQITNVRIGAIKDIVWKMGVDASSNQLDPKNVLSYYSALEQFWLEIPGLIEDSDYAIIENHMKRLNRYSAIIRVKGKIELRDTENFLQLCKGLQGMLNSSLQKKGYFFRLGKPNIKGIDAALAIFKESAWEGNDELPGEIPSSA